MNMKKKIKPKKTPTIIAIVGRSGSGKDYIATHLGLPTVVSYTTREKRESEINGKEHWFISDKEMDKIIKKDNKSKNSKNRNKMIAYTEIGKYRYCALKKDIKETVAYVIDPNGVEYLKENFSDMNIKVVYIYCSNIVREERCKDRSDFNTKWKLRNENENQMFSEFEKNQKWDLKIDNGNKDVDGIKVLKEWIEKIGNEEMEIGRLERLESEEC